MQPPRNDMQKKTFERIYVETSVVSGMFDKNDHPARTKPFWNAVMNGQIRVIFSDILTSEVEDAPKYIRDFFDSIPERQIERIVSTKESNDLAARYIAEGIVSKNSLNDCKHIALATVANADVLVSLNCKHIVKLNRIYQYNGINMLLGYRKIEIRTPEEIINDET